MLIIHNIYVSKEAYKLSSVREVTERLLQPILEERNLELFNIEYKKEGPDWFLRVFIDKDTGVDLDECEYVSTALGKKLDEADIINGAYFLEVSSPGVERPLNSREDFINNIGKNVYVTLYVHIDGEKDFEGTLMKFEEDTVTIEYQVMHRKKLVDIPYDKIAKARLAVAL